MVFGLSVGWPIAVLLGGVSLILVASALVRVGELVVSDRVTSRAFRSQALTVFAGALQTGAVLAVIDATSGRYTSSAAPGAILLFAMVLVTVGVTIATVVVHLVAVSAARAHLAAVDAAVAVAVGGALTLDALAEELRAPLAIARDGCSSRC